MKNSTYQTGFLVFFLIFQNVAAVWPIYGTPKMTPQPSMRVLLKKTDGKTTLKGKKIDIHDAAGLPLCEADQVTLSPKGNGFACNGGKIFTSAFASSKHPFQLDHHGQLMDVELQVQKNNNSNNLLIIYSLPLEQYVEGVLAGEVSRHWPMEALKAQAIAGRSFALMKKDEQAHNLFHIQTTVSDQVFKTNVAESFKQAARGTYGQVLAYGHSLARTFFHSTCGGQTENAKAVWGTDLAYLRGTSCGHCQGSSTFRWQASLPISLIKEKFAINGTIKDIKIGSRNPSGRTDSLQIITPKKTISIKAAKFRMNINPMTLKSTWFSSVKKQGQSFVFSGNGFGHGVGMCQIGSKAMAEKKFDAKQILAHYYPGTHVVQAY